MDIEESVAAHYGHSDAEQFLLGLISAGGGDPESFSPAALNGADQLHIGGAEATSRIAARAGFKAGTHVLDLGSGMGGVSRHLAHTLGATVHGIDLTPRFVELARSLTERTGLSGQATFSQGSILALPFDNRSFDAAVMIHVGMNIQDKDRVFSEASRVLRPGGVFALYDVMLTGDGTPQHPLPWAATAQTSFVQHPSAYSDALVRAGFTVERESTPLAEGIAFLEQALTKGGPAGVDRTALANLLAAFRTGILAPVEMYSSLP